ncbi:type I-E CRISPR-associated protein Cse1/CasA [Streptomyces sp. N2A]|uniref:type I-E CRISPR-associated protein Cse1/CasA n=1 Tax=Streptomyces sp. N2A TaxID=3073936 RepID=UPI0028703B35|nr:type I-E CRISPR-associated protein Cse1/CasA [Streptomyces sp. N2A]
MQTERRRWDPRTEACIPALTTDRNGPVMMNLVQVLIESDRITAICGSTPGETIAVVEYLLGIIHASGHCPADEDEWCDWIEDQTPLNPAADWLANDDPDRWDLFHPEKPLGQNSLLGPWMNSHGVGPAQLVIEHAADYNQFFDHRHLHVAQPLPVDQAFRAMLTQHTYGLGGKAKAKADWIGEALPNQAVGRLNARVRVLAYGDTLADTLRLNLTLTPKGQQGTFNYSWTDGRTRRTFTGAKEKAMRAVDGPADLHTVLGRSVLLHPTGLKDGTLAVDRVLVAAGELLKDLPAPHLQDAIVEEKATKDGKRYRTFLKASETRALWREAHALYAAVTPKEKGTDLYSRLALLGDYRTTLWAVGIVARQTKAVCWLNDTFPLIPARQAALHHAATTGASIAEHADKALYAAASTARNIAYPNPKPGDKAAQIARFNAAPLLYAEAGDLFHALMDDVAAGTPASEALATYAHAITTTSRRVLTERLRSMPSSGTARQAKAEATQRLHTVLTNKSAPLVLKEAAHA